MEASEKERISTLENRIEKGLKFRKYLDAGISTTSSGGVLGLRFLAGLFSILVIFCQIGKLNANRIYRDRLELKRLKEQAGQEQRMENKSNNKRNRR